MEREWLLKEYVEDRFGVSELKPLGEHGRALLVRTGDSLFVVKTLVSHGKWNRYVWAREFLEEKGVNVPKAEFPPESIPHQGLFLVFEEYIPGFPLFALRRPSSSVIEGVVRGIRTIHSIESDRWGPFTKSMKKKGFFKRHLRKIERWASGDPRLQREISGKGWIKKLVKKLEKEVKVYQMTHGDLQGKNIILWGNKTYFIDLVRSGFGSYAKDLARLDVWERRTWGTRTLFHVYVNSVSDPLLEEKLKLFFLGEFVKRREVEWIRDALWKLLDKEELP